MTSFTRYKLRNIGAWIVALMALAIVSYLVSLLG